MWKRLIIIFIAFAIVGSIMLLFSNYAKDNFKEKLYKDYEKTTLEQISTLEQTLKSNPDEPTTYYYLSLAYWHIDKIDLAENYIQLGIKKFPENTSLKLLLGEYYVGLNKINKARELYKELKGSNSLDAEELSKAIKDPSKVPPRGRKNILFPD